MKDKIKKFGEAFKTSETYINNAHTNVSDINVPLVFRKLFPDSPFPTELATPIKMGLPASFSLELKEKFNFEVLWKNTELDYDVSPIPILISELLGNNDFLIKLEYSNVYTNSNNEAAKAFFAIQKEEAPETIHDCKIGDKDYETVKYISFIYIYHSPLLDMQEHKEFFNFIKEYHDKKDIHDFYGADNSTVSMLVKDDGELYFREFTLKSDASLEFADLIYGDGFVDFSNKLLDRISEDNKGLVLFHGKPGTGKTHYIRYLLKVLGALEKRVIYVPPSLVDYMMEPDNLNFIINDITDSQLDTILLIEDAEPLLESRNTNGRSMGISNLLNATDGILNDILGLIVIATFNTDISNIDEALLREGRLIARKEFSTIPLHNYAELGEILGVDRFKLDFKKNYTIADFVGLSTRKNILTHDLKVYRPIGFK